MSESERSSTNYPQSGRLSDPLSPEVIDITLSTSCPPKPPPKPGARYQADTGGSRREGPYVVVGGVDGAVPAGAGELPLLAPVQELLLEQRGLVVLREPAEHRPVGTALALPGGGGTEGRRVRLTSLDSNRGRVI